MKLTKSQAKEIRALKRMKDEEIDFSDIPELVNPKKLVVGKFYRPIKESLTIRIDADVLAWLKGQGKGYQTRINSFLREKMQTTTNYEWCGILSLERAGLPHFARESKESSANPTQL
jgi:uncharacterized protein (DUF4415 family)